MSGDKRGLSNFLDKFKIPSKSHKTVRREAEAEAQKQEQAGQPEGSGGPKAGKAKKQYDKPLKMSKEPLTPQSIYSIIENIKNVKGIEYCAIGGLAYALRGSGRGTADFDIWVRKQDKKKVKEALGQVRGFKNLIFGNRDDPFVFFRKHDGVENHNVDVCICTDFAADFPDLDIATMTEKDGDGVNLPLPQIALAMKVLAWVQHYTQHKKHKDAHAYLKMQNDASDIAYGIGLIIKEKQKQGQNWKLWPKLKEYCTQDFFDRFEEEDSDKTKAKKFAEIGLPAKR